MGWRFRKSIKLLPGVRVSVGKKSASIRFGGKYGGTGLSTTGRKTSRISIPGTGIGFVSTTGGSRQRVARNNSATEAPPDISADDACQPLRKRGGLGLLAAIALAIVWYNSSTHQPPGSPKPESSTEAVESDPAPTAAPQPSAVVKDTSNGATQDTLLLRTTAAVRLREGPSTDTRVLMAVGLGVPVQELGRSGEWRQVSVGTKTGWIRGDYLAEEGPTETATVPTPAREVLQGRASIVDGDTVEIAGQRVRFNGIDAPESEQQCEDAKHFRYSCGAKAAAALDEFLAASRPLRCEFVEWDRYSRYVGNCFRADGLSVAAWLVENGHALDWPKYSDGAYANQQAKAKASGRGMWVGLFLEPWAWRAEHANGARQTTNQPLGIIGSPTTALGSYSCQPRRTCSQIGSCEEANWYLSNRSWGGKLDRDSDGIACETLC
jgi:endonuclease YncB( thermonuclease family)